MKYQIYLNAETSEIINKMAEKDQKKPATFIKQMIESIMRVAKQTALATETEIKKYGYREPKGE